MRAPSFPDLRKSLDPLTESSEIEHTDFLLAQCMVHAGAPDAEHALRRFIAENPRRRISMTLISRWPACCATEAMRLRPTREFSRVDYRQLSPRERERYDIRA